MQRETTGLTLISVLHCFTASEQKHREFFTLFLTTYASALTALRVHFVPKVNVIAERHKFSRREQRHDENILQYVAVLRDMVLLCAFDDKEDEMLRDQIVEKVYSGRIRECLLLEAD